MPKSQLPDPLQELKAPTKYADTPAYALCPTTQFFGSYWADQRPRANHGM